jgi:hypothetical protein
MFTPEESTVVKGALDGAISYTHAMEGLGRKLDGLTTANRPTMLLACRQMARAARDVGSGVLALVGALPEHLSGRGMRRGETVADVVPEAHRGEQLAHAWDGPPNGLTRAIAETLPAVVGSLLSSGEDLSGQVVGAHGALVRLDRAALIHSDPPPGGTFGGRRTIIGPHGDFYQSQHFAWSASHYMHDWAEQGFLPVLANVRLKRKAEMAGCWRLYASIFRTVIQIAALNAGVVLYSGWDNLPSIQGVRQFALTLTALGLQQRAVDMSDGEGLPELFSAHGSLWLMVRPGVALADMPAWDRGMQRMLDAWRRNDNSGWMANVFPDRRAG